MSLPKPHAPQAPKPKPKRRKALEIPGAGLSEIEAFVISLLQMQQPPPAVQVAEALVIATAANNVLKAEIAAVFAQREAGVRAACVLAAVALLSLGYLVL